MGSLGTRHHDLVIIGTGSGNTILSSEMDSWDIAIVEHGKFGGTCLNVGCIPTKMLVLPAERLVESEEADRLGVHIPAGTADWPAIRDRVFGRIDPLAAGGESHRRTASNVTVYDQTALFTGPMRLDTGTGVEITADRWVIAAGGRPRGLDVDGLRGADPDQGVHTSDTIMRVDALPRRVAILGGGVVASEFAHVLDGLGCEVTVVIRSDQMLSHFDEVVAQTFTDLVSKRFRLRRSTKVTAAERRGAQWHLTLDAGGSTTELVVDAVLLAVGRQPNVDLLDVSAAGLPVTDDGVLVVDEHQQTPVEGVFALGDIANTWDLKHVANFEAKVVMHNLLRPTSMRRNDRRAVPRAVFSHPQVASFGPTEAQLRDAGTPFRTYTQKFGDTAYGWALEDTRSVAKVLLGAGGDILAAHLLGPQASTLIQPLVQAAELGQHADVVATGQYWIHPALTEVVENVLLGALDAPLQEGIRA